MNYNCTTDFDVSRRLSSLGLGKPPTSSIQNSATSTSSTSNGNIDIVNYHSGKFSQLHSESLMQLANRNVNNHNNHHHATNTVKLGSRDNSPSLGKPPVAPPPPQPRSQHQQPQADYYDDNLSPDPERRTFSPKAVDEKITSEMMKMKMMMRQLNVDNHDDDDDDVDDNYHSNNRSNNQTNDESNIFSSPIATTSSNYRTPTTHNNHNYRRQDNPGHRQEERQEQEQEQQHEQVHPQDTSPSLVLATPSTINWPLLVEILNLVVEKLNCQLSIVDSFIVSSSSSSSSSWPPFGGDGEAEIESTKSDQHQSMSVPSTTIPASKQLLPLLPPGGKSNNNNNSNNSNVNSNFSWAKTLQQHAAETLEMIDYNLRHSSFGISDVSSRLAGQLEQLRNDLSVIHRESKDVEDILRRREISVSSSKNKSSYSNNSNSSSYSSTSSSSSVSPIDLWANGYLQRLSVAHDLAHRILFESAKYITRAASLSPFYNNRSSNANNNSASRERNGDDPQHSPLYFRYHEGIALLDNIDPRKVLISSGLLLASCEQYARCCLMEYERRMRDRCELYARASFVELNVIIPMTSQVASMQLSLDEKESNLRLAAARAGKAEQKLREATIEFSERERQLKEEIFQLMKTAKNDVLIRRDDDGREINENGSTAPTFRHRQQEQQQQPSVAGLPASASSLARRPQFLSAHQQNALARGKKLNVTQEELTREEEEEEEEDYEAEQHRLQQQQQQQKQHQKDSSVPMTQPHTSSAVEAGMLTPRTKTYHGKYLGGALSSITATATPTSALRLTPGAAERMMEQVTMQLADEFSANVSLGAEARDNEIRLLSSSSPSGIRLDRSYRSSDVNRRGIESPLEKLARMSSPVTPSSAVANSPRSQQRQQEQPQQQQQQQQQQFVVANKETRSSLLRAGRNNQPSSSLSASRSVRSPRKDIVPAHSQSFSPSSSASSSFPLPHVLPAKAAASSSSDYSEPPSVKMLDAANARISQQLESAKSSFLAMKEKYGNVTTTTEATHSQSRQPPQQQQHLVSTPRGSFLTSHPTAAPTSILKSSSFSSSSSTGASQRQQNTPRHAHFDSSVVVSNSGVKGNGGNTSHDDDNQKKYSNLVALEQLVLEQRSELSTFRAHLKGIEAQEAEVSKKRQTVAASLKQSQAQIDYVSEEDLRAANDRIALVWAKIEEATDRLKKNRREVLSKMELLTRTLRNSEREWNKAKMELTREGKI